MLFSIKELTQNLAAKIYSKALQKAPNNDVLFTNRALCKMKMKKFDDAAIDAREAISLQPMSVKDRVQIFYTFSK